ncbi:MAG: hypothetical protein ACK4NF_06155 [Planctomycetota bacterium]
MGKVFFCEDEANTIFAEVENEFKKLKDGSVKVAIFSSANPHFLSYEKQIYKNALRFKNIKLEKFIYDIERPGCKDRIIDDISLAGEKEEYSAIFIESYIQKYLKNSGVVIDEYLPPSKDLEAIHPYNLGNIFIEEKQHLPPAVSAILRVMSRIKDDLKGMKVVIVNHSEIIGKPLAIALLQSKTNAPTVTVCHIATANLPDETRKGDFLITAIGSPNFFTADYVKEGAVVIDVGFTKIGSQIFGDVDLKSVINKVSWITPVPGGIGLLTLSYFFYNIICCLKKQGRM